MTAMCRYGEEGQSGLVNAFQLEQAKFDLAACKAIQADRSDGCLDRCLDMDWATTCIYLILSE